MQNLLSLLTFTATRASFLWLSLVQVSFCYQLTLTYAAPKIKPTSSSTHLTLFIEGNDHLHSPREQLKSVLSENLERRMKRATKALLVLLVAVVAVLSSTEAGRDIPTPQGGDKTVLSGSGAGRQTPGGDKVYSAQKWFWPWWGGWVFWDLWWPFLAQRPDGRGGKGPDKSADGKPDYKNVGGEIHGNSNKGTPP